MHFPSLFSRSLFTAPRAHARSRSQRGFTFIEILVVTILIGVLSSIVVVSFSGASKVSRDARRKKDLAAVQVALEVYKTNTGSYPDHSNCGASATWPGCATPWIAGMTEEYLSQLPTDPKQNTTGSIGNTDGDTYTYNYIRVTATSYYLLARLENASDTGLNGADFGFTGERIYVVTQPK